MKRRIEMDKNKEKKYNKLIENQIANNTHQMIEQKLLIITFFKITGTLAIIGGLLSIFFTLYN